VSRFITWPGSSQIPVCTGDGWMIVLRGELSQ
jgi:hypothetical protein